MRNSRSFLLNGLACAAILLAPVAANAADAVIVASKNYTESILAAHMMADALEAAGIPVERQIGLGGTGVIHQALLSGEIDTYPEYTGTALLVQLKLPVNNDPAVVYDTVKEEYERQFESTWLSPFGFNDTYALAMKREKAEELGLKTMSDLVEKAGDLTIGSTQEFLVRPDALPGLESTYGMKFGDSRGMDPGLVYQAIASGAVDVISVFTTDARIKANDLVVLEDDKMFFPPYYLTPVIRMETVKENPAVAEALEKLGGLFTAAEMIELNAAVDIDKRPAEEVAAEALKAKGVIE
ncbi:glycine betaine ABC transporter substrate-binding protein [Acuticoccus kandeliae]|uniref:ABC transporter substrate-binding protein n=1 Tax=Acuticoccus kandeliae TaxID=2073160 RepID=UPI000D3EBA5F|nr:glycine betaine ABC transporter substrate-binding protein [Acuticoccus kandeliae]